MSEDLLLKLRLLEEDYQGQPPLVQQADLREINGIRSQLGMPLVDARLNELGAAAHVQFKVEAPRAPVEPPDHAEAREIYQAYLKKLEELEVHKAYAQK